MIPQKNLRRNACGQISFYQTIGIVMDVITLRSAVADSRLFRSMQRLMERSLCTKQSIRLKQLAGDSLNS